MSRGCFFPFWPPSSGNKSNSWTQRREKDNGWVVKKRREGRGRREMGRRRRNEEGERRKREGRERRGRKGLHVNVTTVHLLRWRLTLTLNHLPLFGRRKNLHKFFVRCTVCHQTIPLGSCTHTVCQSPACTHCVPHSVWCKLKGGERRIREGR